MNNIEFILPQFERTDGIKPSIPNNFSGLNKLSDETLKQIGCQIWDSNNNGTLWLFPAEWYDYIPNGLEVVDINFEKGIFERGVTDNDKRFGALSFGVLKVKG